MFERLSIYEWLVLRKLARRRSKDVRSWCYFKEKNGVQSIYTCFICDNDFAPSERVEHGINHLKERGLLVFI